MKTIEAFLVGTKNKAQGLANELNEMLGRFAFAYYEEEDGIFKIIGQVTHEEYEEYNFKNDFYTIE